MRPPPVTKKADRGLACAESQTLPAPPSTPPNAKASPDCIYCDCIK